jgi:hypothetical protein
MGRHLSLYVIYEYLPSDNLPGTVCVVIFNSTSCRFILPDKATTVVTPTPGESIRWLVSRLLEKRGLRFVFLFFLN